MSIIAGILFALLTAYLLLRPHLASAAAAFSSDASSLSEQKSRMVQLLRDLDFDNATGKMNGEDYERTKNELEHELADLLTRMDNGR